MLIKELSITDIIMSGNLTIDNFLTVFDCPYDESIHGVFEGEFEKQHFTTKYSWDSFQLHAFQAIKRGDNVLTVAPTSSGKTSVAKYAMLRNLLMKEDKRVVYTTPTKSLSNEKFGEMREVLAPYGIVPGLLTGDQKINVDSRFLIMTAEILCNALFMLKRKDEVRDEMKKMIDSNNDLESSLKNQYELDKTFVNSIGCVIIDEIHYVSDRSRGGVWETTLVLLNPSVQIIGLSATISGPELFASLLGKIKRKKITLVKKYDRPVPLEYAIYNGHRLVTILDTEGNYYSEDFRDTINDLKKDEKKYEKNNNKIQSMLNSFVRYAKEKDLLQLCFIVFSKKNCEKFADHISINLIDGKESVDAVRELEKKMGVHLKSYENMPRYRQIKGMIQKGVCFHHAGIPVIMKEVIEHLFKTNHIKVLFATETIAIGVNMPIRTLVLSSVEKSVDSQMQTLNAAEFNQICGRAGRRGLDCKGLIVFLPLYDQMSEPQIRNELLFGPLPRIESRMELTYHSYLKLSQSSAINKEEFYENSLLSIKNNFMTMGLFAETNKIKDQLDLSKKKIEEYVDLNKINPIVLQEIKEYALISSEPKRQLFDKSFIQIKPNKQQLKYQKKLEEITKTHKDLYDLVIKNNKLAKDYSKQCEVLSKYQNYKNERFDQIAEFLRECEYLSDEGEITEFGKMASFVNECNPFILTEIFTGNILQKMSPIQIICFLSILTDKIISTSDLPEVLLKNVHVDPIIINAILYIEDRISGYIDLENRMGQYSEPGYWDISYDYLELSYLWATMNILTEDHSRILTKLYNMGEYEGSFIKNMLKINSIVNNLILLCGLTQNLDLLPVLQEIERLILKGMVNVDSLHVS